MCLGVLEGVHHTQEQTRGRGDMPLIGLSFAGENGKEPQLGDLFLYCLSSTTELRRYKYKLGNKLAHAAEVCEL